MGSLAVILNKPPSPIETVNDIDRGIVNLFKVIRDTPDELTRIVEFTPWSRSEYKDILPKSMLAADEDYFIWTGDSLEDARRMLIRCWMSCGAKTSDRSSWAHNVQKQKHGGVLNCPKRWNRLPEAILKITDRLKLLQIENMPALDLIQHYQYPEVLN